MKSPENIRLTPKSDNEVEGIKEQSELGITREHEKYKKEILDGQETAKLAEDLYAECSPEFAECLVHSNVALTLSGLKPQTEFFIDYNSEEELEKIEEDIVNLNNYVSANDLTHIMFRGGNPIGVQRTDGQKAAMVSVENFMGIERVSKSTEIPGVGPYDKDTGFDGVVEWAKKTMVSIEEKMKAGEIEDYHDVDILFSGLTKGYPDRAVFDFSEAHQKEKMDELVSVPIARVGTYDEAEPIYDVFPEHMNDSSVRENVQQAEEILEVFYNSKWHTKLNLDIK